MTDKELRKLKRTDLLELLIEQSKEVESLKKRIEELEQDVSKLLQMNVRLTNEIDPKLIGGFKILVEGRIIDASIRKKFDDLESQINLN